MCIEKGVNYTGTIVLNGGTLCNTGTVANINFKSGIFNNYGNYTKTGNLVIQNTGNVTYNSYTGSTLKVTGDFELNSTSSTNQFTIFLNEGKTFWDLAGNFNVLKGTMLINPVTKEKKFSEGVFFNVAKDFYVATNATLNVTIARGAYFNIGKSLTLDGKLNKTITNNGGALTIKGNLNVFGNGTSQGIATITNSKDGGIFIGRNVSIVYNNGTVNFTNYGKWDVGGSWTQTTPNTNIINYGSFSLSGDLTLDKGGIITNYQSFYTRDLEVIKGTFTNNNYLSISRDLNMSSPNGILNNNKTIIVARTLINQGTINLGQKSSVSTTNLQNESAGTISGPLSIAGDSTNYAYLEVANYSKSEGFLARYLWVNDLTPPNTTIQLDSYGNTNRLGSPLVIIGPKTLFLCLFSALNYKVNPKPVFCPGTTITIALKSYITLTGATFAGTSYTLQTASGNTVNTTGIFNYVINTTTAFTGFVRIGTATSGCTKTLAFTLNVTNLTADAGPDVFVTPGTNVTLGGAPSASNGIGIYGYSWLPTGTYVPSNNNPNPTTFVNTTTTFSLTVTDVFPVGSMYRTCTAKNEKLVYIINEPYYFVLKKTLDAGYYNSFNGKIYFMFEEEYYDPTTNAPLNYTIVSDINTPVVTTSAPLTEKIGDNRFQLNVTSLGLINDEYYRIKITNEKNEVWYARFKYRSIPCPTCLPN